VTVSVDATPALRLEKSTTLGSITAVGQEVPYTFLVTNGGNQTVTDVAVDDLVAAPSDPGSLSPVRCPATSLAPGESVSCTATYRVAQADLDAGAVNDTATASAKQPGGEPVDSPPSTVSVPAAPAAGLTLVKATTVTTVTRAGQIVPYTFTVTNSGNQTMTGLAVTDTVAPPSDPANLSAVDCPRTALAPAESVTCTATYTTTAADLAAAALQDDASATADPPTGPPVRSAPSRVTIPVVTAPLGNGPVQPPVAGSAPLARTGTDDGDITVGLLMAGLLMVTTGAVMRSRRRSRHQQP
jgi:uncharacterized repeat protein (TIGR01451 family)